MTPEIQANDVATARKRATSRLALISNSFLLAMKLIVAAGTGSVAVLAEVVNSGADLMASIIVFWSVKVSDEPPDATHAYGHGKIENLSGILVAGLIIAGGFYAVWQSIVHLFHPQPLFAVDYGIAVMAVSALVNYVVSARMITVGCETESPALTADGVHLRTDVMTSIAVVVGLGLVTVTHRPIWDAVAGLGVALMILRVGGSVARDALETLTDHSLPDAERKALENVLRANPSVRGFHALRTRKSGSHRYADVHVLFDDDHTLVQAHRLAEEIEDEMRRTLPNLDTMVHPEPYNEEVKHQRERHRELQENMKEPP